MANKPRRKLSWYRKRITIIGSTIGVTVVVCTYLLFGYFSFPDEWYAYSKDAAGDPTPRIVDYLYYYGDGMAKICAGFLLLINIKTIFPKHLWLHFIIRVWFWIWLLAFLDLFLTPTVAKPLEWLGIVAIIAAHLYIYIRKRYFFRSLASEEV